MSNTNLITCPNCGHQFSLSDVQKHEMEEMREKMKTEVEADMKKRAFAWAQEEVKKAEAKAREDAQKQAVELEDLRKKRDEAEKKEMEFLKQSQEFENMKRNQALELEKAKMEERKKVEEEARKQAEERAKFENEKMKLESDKRIAELTKQLEMTQRAVEDANRKANQGSMQIQGEIQEDALKELLQQSFPIDIISDVEKGIKGADIIQEVRNDFGQSVGVIAWESKNTKAWSDGWVEKLKEDRLRVGAGVSVIVSSVLPEGVNRFGLYRDIWVTDYESVLPLTIALRAHIIEMTKVRNSLKGKDEKMEVLYNYLISPEFKAKIENIVEAFSTMKDDLDREKRAMEKMWSAREKQLSRVIDNTARLYGDMQGLIGSQLGTVEYLELGGGEE
ncbi:MAG: DUF2130 domain-containing protein [Candidatus Gracilibacteria bacterium]|nr:DUF2130 domain-containing protein [Candidatus Gracilibacteria bacterium]